LRAVPGGKRADRALEEVVGEGIDVEVSDKWTRVATKERDILREIICDVLCICGGAGPERRLEVRLRSLMEVLDQGRT
jgi:hypothetical protein